MRHIAITISFMLVAGSASAGCATIEDTQGEDARAAVSPPTGTAEAQLTLPAVCTDHRWVGLRGAGGHCRPAAGWQVAPLIEGSVATEHGTADEDFVVGDYCVYEWPSTSTTVPNVDALPPGLDRDCFAMAAHTSSATVEGLVNNVLFGAHRKQMEMPVVPAVIPGGGTVNVAIIDTWARESNPGRSLHGIAMAGIVEGIACKAVAGPCPVEVRPFLALDRFGPDRERSPILGGTYGPQSQLARAIVDALNAPRTGPLILNLSVGWSARYNASTAQPGKRRHAVRAVEAALRLAACEGALVIAAAGNATGGPDPDDEPIYPAAYEKTAAPACVGTTRPLVYSVGGRDGRDQRIANTRPGATPVLAAPSFAVPSVSSTTTATAVLDARTGTSVSAADVSAIAALVWHIDDTLPPHKVMQFVREGAQMLPDVAEYCLTPPCEKVRRVSVCRAMQRAGATVSCPDPIDAGAGVNPDLSGLLSTIDGHVDVWADGSGLVVPSDARGVCSIPTMSGSLLLGPEVLCPNEVLSSDLLIPSIDPQPIKDPCPACSVSIHAVIRDASNPTDFDLDIGLNMPITTTIGLGVRAVPQTLTFSQEGRTVARFNLGSAVTPNGYALRNGLLAGSTYGATLVSEEPFVYGTDFGAASIEWTDPMSFKTSFPIVTVQ